MSLKNEKYQIDNYKYSNNTTSLYINTLTQNIENYIGNIRTSLNQIKSDDFVLPFTCNEHEYPNSYVCSPYTALYSYSKQEVNKLDNYLVKQTLKLVLPITAYYMKNNYVNKIISVNNWMLSTNLYPENWRGNDLSDLKSTLVDRYPEHTIMFRSLNSFSNQPIIDKLQQAGYDLIPSRQIYIYHPSLNQIRQRNNIKNDFRLLRKTQYQIVKNDDIPNKWIPRIADLYNQLYIKKYSIHNPMFTAEYIRFALKSNYFDFEVFVNRRGHVDAVGGRFQLDGTCTLPIVGYDTSKSKQLGLYRLVLASTTKYALDNNLIFNASSGASEFKLLRGGVPFIEYSAIYTKHLSKTRRNMWRRLAYILSHYIEPLLIKYKL